MQDTKLRRTLASLIFMADFTSAPARANAFGRTTYIGTRFMTAWTLSHFGQICGGKELTSMIASAGNLSPIRQIQDDIRVCLELISCFSGFAKAPHPKLAQIDQHRPLALRSASQHVRSCSF